MRKLATDLLVYVENAYVFFGRTGSDNYSRIGEALSLSDKVPSEYSGDLGQSVNTSGISEIFSEATWALGSTIRIRFTVKASANAYVKLSYTDALGNTVYYVKHIEDGLCDGSNYIYVPMRAFDINSTVRIELYSDKDCTSEMQNSDGDAICCEYALDSYIGYVTKDYSGTDKDVLVALVKALWTYSKSAREYKIYSNENGIK